MPRGGWRRGGPPVHARALRETPGVCGGVLFDPPPGWTRAPNEANQRRFSRRSTARSTSGRGGGPTHTHTHFSNFPSLMDRRRAAAAQCALHRPVPGVRFAKRPRKEAGRLWPSDRGRRGVSVIADPLRCTKTRAPLHRRAFRPRRPWRAGSERQQAFASDAPGAPSAPAARSRRAPHARAGHAHAPRNAHTHTHARAHIHLPESTTTSPGPPEGPHRPTHAVLAWAFVQP